MQYKLAPTINQYMVSGFKPRSYNFATTKSFSIHFRVLQLIFHFQDQAEAFLQFKI